MFIISREDLAVFEKLICGSVALYVGDTYHHFIDFFTFNISFPDIVYYYFLTIFLPI